MSDLTASEAQALDQDMWRRWEMSSIAPEEPPAPVSEPDPAQTAQQIARLRELEQLAEQRGYDAGYQKGYAEGLSAGTAAGLEEGRKNGYALGHAEGSAAGYAEGQDKAKAEAQALALLAGKLAEALARMEQDIGQGVISLAIGIAEQVVRKTLTTDTDALLSIVREIVQMHGDSDVTLVIHTHPDDQALVQQYLADDACVKRWRILADTTIERGGCIAHTALGAIDASLATRWRRAVAALGQPATSNDATP